MAEIAVVRTPDKTLVDTAAWDAAVTREAVIRALAGRDRLARAEVASACRELGVRRTRLYQLLAAYRVRPVTSSLLPRPAGSTAGRGV